MGGERMKIFEVSGCTGVAVGFLEVAEWWVRIFEVAVVSADSRGVQLEWDGWLSREWGFSRWLSCE